MTGPVSDNQPSPKEAQTTSNHKIMNIYLCFCIDFSLLKDFLHIKSSNKGVNLV